MKTSDFNCFQEDDDDENDGQYIDEVISTLNNVQLTDSNPQPEIQYYDKAFPSLPTSNAEKVISPHIKFIQQLSTTKTFTIPYEERRYVDNETNKSLSNNLRKTLKDICMANNVFLETNVTPSCDLIVFITGRQNNVTEAQRKIIRVLQTQHEKVLDIPKEYHRHVIGLKGVILKEIENETGSQIIVPKPNEASNAIILRGSKDAIEHAAQIVQTKVDEMSKIDRQVIEVDKRFHQLVSHKSNSSLHVVLERKHLRLDIPPLSVDKNQISISGDKEGVKQAAAIIKQTYDRMRATYQELQIDVPREKHRFIIGPKGSHIKEILDKTGVWVQVSNNDLNNGRLLELSNGEQLNKEGVLLLGPTENLGAALTEIFTRTESVHIKTIPAAGWLHKFIIGKKGVHINQLTADKPNLNLSFETESNEIVVEGPPVEVDQVCSDLERRVFELESQLSHRQITIEPEMIKHLIGQGGANIGKIRRETDCSLVFSSPAADSFVTICGAHDNVAAAQAALEKTIQQIENTSRKELVFPHHLIPQLIGQNGRGLKEIREQLPEVRITLPSPESSSNIIYLVGPRADVDKFYLWLQKKSKELIESNYSKKVMIPRKFHKAIIGKEGIIIRDLTKSTNTKFQIPSPSEEKDEIIITGRKSDVEQAEQKILNIYHKENNIIEVGIEISKNLHTILIGKGGSRVNQLKESCGGQVTVRFPAPESQSNTVIVKGLKEDVFRAQAKLHELVEEVTASNYEMIFQLDSAEEMQFLLMVPEAKLKSLREKFHIRPAEIEDKTSLKLVGQKKDVSEAYEHLKGIKESILPIVSEKLVLPSEHIVYFQNTNEFSRIGKQQQCKIISEPIKDHPAESTIEFRGPSSYIDKAKVEILQIIDDYENTISDSLVIDEKQFNYLTRFNEKQLNDIIYQNKFTIEIFPDNAKYGNQLSTNSTDEVTVTPPLTSNHLDTNNTHNEPDSCYSEEESFKSMSPNVNHSPDSLINGFISKHHQHQHQHQAEEQSIRSSGISLHLDSLNNSRLPKYRMFLSGRSELMNQVKEAIISLLVVDLEVDVPSDYYPLLIGAKGATINELREQFSVNIIIPDRGVKAGGGSAARSSGSSNKVVVSGPSECAVRAKQEIMQRVNQAILENEQRALRNFKLVVKVPVKYHRAFIGIKGENISNIRKQFNVRISVPNNINSNTNKSEQNTENGDSPLVHNNNDQTKEGSDNVIVQGHKDDVHKAAEAINKFVHRLESSVIEDLIIDWRLHSRLIGSRGANLNKIRQKYQVEVAFPPRGSNTDGSSPEANIVKVKGTKEAVDLCCDDLVEQAQILWEEYEEAMPIKQPSTFLTNQNSQENSNHFDSFDDTQYDFRNHSNSSNKHDNNQINVTTIGGGDSGNSNRSNRNSGFCVLNAPWQQNKSQEPSATGVSTKSTNNVENWADTVDDHSPFAPLDSAVMPTYTATKKWNKMFSDQ